jgi:hypothetical protein
VPSELVVVVEEQDRGLELPLWGLLIIKVGGGETGDAGPHDHEVIDLAGIYHLRGKFSVTYPVAESHSPRRLSEEPVIGPEAESRRGDGESDSLKEIPPCDRAVHPEIPVFAFHERSLGKAVEEVHEPHADVATLKAEIAEGLRGKGSDRVMKVKKVLPRRFATLDEIRKHPPRERRERDAHAE